MESLSSMTLTTEMRQRSVKCEPACDANGNVPFCKSANMIVPTHSTTETTTIMTNGHYRYRDENLNEGLTEGKPMNGVACNGSSHLIGNGKVPIEANTTSESSTSWRLELPATAKLVTTSAAGVVFGFAMEKGRVFEPRNIRGQMLFQNFVMLKMFLSAIVASIVWFTVLSLLPATASKFRSARTNIGCRMNSKGAAAAGIGGALLGIGMAMSGACPGAALIEVGAGVHNAGMTFVGCLLGALLYGLTEQTVNRWLKPTNQITVGKLDERFGMPYSAIALPLALIIVLALALIEYMAPWQSELTSPNAELVSTGVWDLLTLRSWPPIAAGVLVGCLQLPIVLAVDEPIGGSRGYCTMVSRVLPEALLERCSSYLKDSRTGLKNWWQVVYISSAIAGAAASALFSGTWASTSGVAPLHALLGGATMVYGSRLAGGCTSGHGLSGIGVLSLMSFVAIPSMFVGGMATAAAMTFAGVY